MGASPQPSVLAPGSSEGAAAVSAPGKELQRAWEMAQGGEGPLQERGLGGSATAQSVQVCLQEGFAGTEEHHNDAEGI